MSGAGEQRFPCKICGRQFVQQSLSVHERVCAKSANKKRKVFDSAKQRAEGTEVTYRQIKQSQKKDIAPPKSNWRAKHQDFINAVRSARGTTKALQEGGPLPPPPPPSINPDYIQCPHCSRRFNQTAADRHISFCKEQSQRIGARQPSQAAAKAKQTTRIQYQPPKPKVKNSAGSFSSPMVGTGSRLPAPGGSRIPGPGSANRTVGTTPPSGRGRSSGSSQHQDEDEQQVQSPPVGRALRTGRDVSNYQQAKKEAQQMRLGSKVSSSGLPISPGIPKSGSEQCPVGQGWGGKGRAVPLTTQLGRFAARPAMSTPSMLPTALSHHASEPGMQEITAHLPSEHLHGSNGKVHQEATADKTPPNRMRHPYEEDWQHSVVDSPPSNGNPFSTSSTNKLQPMCSTRSSRNKISGSSLKLCAASGTKKLKPSAFVEPTPLPKFCYACGSRYPVTSAKFCCECGVRRVVLS